MLLSLLMCSVNNFSLLVALPGTDFPLPSFPPLSGILLHGSRCRWLHVASCLSPSPYTLSFCCQLLFSGSRPTGRAFSQTYTFLTRQYQLFCPLKAPLKDLLITLSAWGGFCLNFPPNGHRLPEACGAAGSLSDEETHKPDQSLGELRGSAAAGQAGWSRRARASLLPRCAREALLRLPAPLTAPSCPPRAGASLLALAAAPSLSLASFPWGLHEFPHAGLIPSLLALSCLQPVHSQRVLLWIPPSL